MIDVKSLLDSIAASLMFAADDHCSVKIADAIVEEVASYLMTNASEDFTSEDVRRAVGHTLCKRMNVQ